MKTLVTARPPAASTTGGVEMEVMPAQSPVDAFAASGDVKHLFSDDKFVAALEIACKLLSDRLSKKDAKARNMLVKSQLTMYANYDNKWNGLINDKGFWEDYNTGSNDYGFSVPLLKSHVDTALTFYCKTKPRYTVSSNINRYNYTQLASMCQTIVGREYERLMTYTSVQTEGLYALLGGVAQRNLVMRVDDASRKHIKEQTTSSKKIGDDAVCSNCGNGFFIPEYLEDVTCPNCLSSDVKPSSEVFESEKMRISYRRPRIQLDIIDPTKVQTDFKKGASTFHIKRDTIERHKAEFEFKRQFAGRGNISVEAEAADRMAREPVIEGLDLYGVTAQSVLDDYLTNVFTDANEKLSDNEYWLDPCEYGVIKIMGHNLYEYFPDGLYYRLVNGQLVAARHGKQNREWIPVVAGLRPSSNQGAGLMHLAELNDLINNAINLEYSVLRASGFPITIIREKYMQGILPQANNAILLKDVPDDKSNDEIITRLPAHSASGMLGVMSQRLESFMGEVGATWSFSAASGNMRNMMGTATGASAIQEMMTDRLGLILQNRIEADSQMLANILTLMQDSRSPELESELKEEFDSDIVELFFQADLRAILSIRAEKGSDTPMLESLNVYKMQTFAQLTASLTGLREFDASSFYDLVGAIGDALNLPVEIGSGRKEKHYANVQIAKVESNYQEFVEKNKSAQVTPDQIALQLFEQVKSDEAMILSVVPSVELTLFDHKSLSEVYSDWIQSKSGMESALPVKMTIVMMYGYHQMVLDKKKADEEQKAMQMQMMAQGIDPSNLPGAAGGAAPAAEGGAPEGAPEPDPDATPEGEVPDNVKRDGTTGAGRPRDVDSPQEVADTLSEAGVETASPIETGIGVV